jgi:hypothetical protein
MGGLNCGIVVLSLRDRGKSRLLILSRQVIVVEFASEESIVNEGYHLNKHYMIL